VHSAQPESYRMKQPSTTRWRLGALAVALALAAVGCGGGGANTGPPDAAPQSLSAGTATLSWTPVTESTDGKPLTDLAGYRVYGGTSPNDLTTVAVLPDPSATTYQATNLSSGTWYFAVAAYTSNGTVGPLSNVAETTVE
jgi:hypothetical protein